MGIFWKSEEAINARIEDLAHARARVIVGEVLERESNKERKLRDIIALDNMHAFLERGADVSTSEQKAKVVSDAVELANIMIESLKK